MTRGAIATRNERRPNLLRGLITCTCGRAMSPDHEHGRKRVYRCSSKTVQGGACGAKRAVADVLEPRVWSALVRRLSDPALIEAEDDRWRARQPDALLESALASARRALATIERQQHKAVRLHLLAGDDDADGDDGTTEVIGRELARLGRERAAAAAAVADLEARATAATVAAEQRAALWTYCQAVQGELDGLDFDERRAWLEAFDVRVVANGPDWSGTARIRLGEVVVLGTPVKRRAHNANSMAGADSIVAFGFGAAAGD